MELTNNAWRYAVTGGAVATAGYFLLPTADAQSALYSALGLASVVCIVVGVRIHRPADPLGWYLLAAAGACFTIGDDVWTLYGSVLHATVPFPSIADGWYLAGYPFLFAGVLRLTRNPNRSARREDNADAAIVAMGALAVSWHFLMNAYVQDAALTAFGLVVNLAYPVMDVVLVFIVFRTLLFRGPRQPYHLLLSAAMLTMFVADITYDLLVLHDSYTSGNAVDALFLAEYVLVAAAALHPSMAVPLSDAPAPGDSGADEVLTTRRRIPVVILAGFVPPAILVIAASLGRSVNVPVLAGLCIAVFAVICLRLVWLIDRIGGQARVLRDSEAHLRHMAFHDELTGLPNRVLLGDRVEQALRSVTRSGAAVALCFADLDGFKTVNDTLGHQVGDTVLQKVGVLLQGIVRPGDTVARIGGDEFAILMADVTDRRTGVEFANRIISVVREAVEFEDELAGISMSVGMAFADATTAADQLISEADAAMHEAKARRRDQVEVFESAMRARLVARLELTSRFRGSLERGEFLLHFQPIYSLGHGRLHGFEALVRWRHPTIGLVPPLDFIPVAEETGFIVPLGRWILIAACEQVEAWNSLTDEPVTVAVNVSRRQLVSQHLVDDVRTALVLTGIAPQQLILEVTESVLMEHPEQVIATLTELRALGVRISVDDFGTGFSSLSYLQRFPADVLKIDKSFVDQLDPAQPGGPAIVTSIIELAHHLHLAVVAEGIERDDQYRLLAGLGCDYGQGYLMSRPLDPRASEALVEASTGAATIR